MEKVKKGDIVARRSYGCDILFSVENIIKSTNGIKIVILKGITVRILADAYVEDLVILDEKQLDDSLRSLDIKIEDRINRLIKLGKKTLQNKERNINYVGAGTILHLDGDKLYSEKSARYYKKMGLKAIVKNVPENKQYLVVKDYINKYTPDVLVLTGHDGMIKTGTKYGDLSNYRNSKYFAQAVVEARKVIPTSNKLAIFAGACQSFFEIIMASGANFASSPGRILIDFMDPLIVAEKIATTERSKFVTINDIVNDLRDGKKSIGGSGVMGKKNL